MRLLWAIPSQSTLQRTAQSIEALGESVRLPGRQSRKKTWHLDLLMLVVSVVCVPSSGCQSS